MLNNRKGNKLTVKQQRFVEYYDGNGVDTARKAGYKGNEVTLASVAYENLRKPHIRAAIEAREIRTNANGIMNREERQKFWSDVMCDKDADMKDRLKASELLGRSNADFTENNKKDGDIIVNVVTKYVDYGN